MSFKDRWFAEYERKLEDKLELGWDWDEASVFASMAAEKEFIEREVERVAYWLNDRVKEKEA